MGQSLWLTAGEPSAMRSIVRYAARQSGDSPVVIDGPRICSAPRRKRDALRSIRGTRHRLADLSTKRCGVNLALMDAEASPSRSISTYLRGALNACRGAWMHAARLALDIALPTLCVACREPVDGEGVCAECWARLSFIAPPFCPKLGIPFVYDPGPGLLSMEAISDPPAYQRARAAVRYDDVARTLVHALKYHDRTDLAPAMGRWWRGPGVSCWRRPTRWCRCRCTGGAAGAAVTTSPVRWRARSSGKAA